MTENLQADGVQSRQAVVVRCCLKEIKLDDYGYTRGDIAFEYICNNNTRGALKEDRL
ncbi:MAG: hypothetical protein J6O40_03130 [Ruminococcus sp.]|nr:hypothetical protein [Ruminococcus sp.]